MQTPSGTGPAQTPAETGSETGAASSQEPGGGYGLPDYLNGRWLTLFSIGHISERGTTTTDGERSNDMYTDASASFAYQMQRERSQSNLHYDVSGRRYNRFRSFDTITHDAGAGYSVRLSPRLAWSADYQYRFTPDAYREVVTARIIQQQAPSGSPSDEMVISQGLVPVQIDRTIHSANSSLSYDISRRTALSLGAAYWQYQYGGGLSGSRQYSARVGIGRALSEATTVTMEYDGNLLDDEGQSGRTYSHGLVFSLSRSLTPSTSLFLSAGPAYSVNRGESVICLSPLQQEILGRTVLVVEEDAAQLGWQATARFRYRQSRVRYGQSGRSFGLSYSRAVSLADGLGSASTRDRYEIDFGHPLTRTTTVELSAQYLRNNLFQILNPIHRDDRSVRAAISQGLGAFGVSVFGYYSRPRGTDLAHQNYTQFGVHLTYRYPRTDGL